MLSPTPPDTIYEGLCVTTYFTTASGTGKRERGGLKGFGLETGLGSSFGFAFVFECL